MRQPNPNLGNTILSFVGLGIFIVLIICALIFFSYLFIIGAIIGLILWVIAYLRQKFGKPKAQPFYVKSDRNEHRTIDQDKE